MNYLESEISALYASAHELCYLGMDGRPIYSDQFTRLNRDVFSQANALYDKHGDSDEEEARLCLSLLMGYNATLYNNGDKEGVSNIFWIVAGMYWNICLPLC